MDHSIISADNLIKMDEIQVKQLKQLGLMRKGIRRRFPDGSVLDMVVVSGPGDTPIYLGVSCCSSKDEYNCSTAKWYRPPWRSRP